MALALCVLAGAYVAHAAPLEPAPSPTPRLVLSGEGGVLRDGLVPTPNDLFGYFGRVVHGVTVSFCREDGRRATQAFLSGVAPSGGACRSSQPLDFASSAIPLRESDVATFAAAGGGTGGRGTLVQIPYVASSVAFLYNNPDVVEALRLSVPTVCAIADGEITNWNAIPRDPTNPSGSTYPARPLRFVVREDADGETFALANFLSSHRPNGAPSCAKPGETFALSDRYGAGVLPHPLPAGARVGGFVATASDAAAIDCIAARSGRCGAGAIGYVDPVDAFAAALRPPVGIARLYVVRDGIGRDEDPIADLPGVAARLRAYVLDRVLAPFVPNGRPPRELQPQTSLGRDGCIAVIPPSAYAFPDVGYPIVTIADMWFASAGNGEKAGPLRTLAALTNDDKNFAWKRIRTIDPTTIARGERGTSALPLSTSRKTGIPAIAACIGRTERGGVR